MPLSENHKIIELQCSLEKYPSSEIPYVLFDTANEVKSNKRTFKSLANSCLKHWNGLEDKGTATAGSHGYTNAAKAQKKESISTGIDAVSCPSMEERLEKMEQAFMNAAKSSSTPEVGQAKRKKPNFCDNHGWCMYETKNCRDTAKSGKQRNNHDFPIKKEPKGKK